MPDLEDDGFTALLQVVESAWFGNGEARRSTRYRNIQTALEVLIRESDLAGVTDLHETLLKRRSIFEVGGPKGPRTPAWATAAIFIWTCAGGLLNEFGVHAGIGKDSPAIKFTVNVLVRSGYSGAAYRSVADWLNAKGAKDWLNNA